MRSSVRLGAAGALLAAALGVVLVQTQSASAESGSDHGRLLSTTVAGSLPTDPVLFGAAPGGAPWVVDRGDVRLDASGRLDVRVRGLVIPTTGTNPVPTVAASVACNGVVVATTAAVPFSADGDARIRTSVTVPERCLAPAVLLSPNGISTVYIGVSGQE